MKSKLLLAAASLLTGLLLCELILWAFAGSVYPPPLYPGDVEPERDATYDALVGWKLPPETTLTETTDEYSVSYRSNAQGFRATRDFEAARSEETNASEEATRRIAFLGDSYTFGSGVEDDETFAAVLETMLPDTRSDNFGIGAFGIDQMWMTLRHHALPQNPDLVILGFIRYDLDRSLSTYRRDHIWRWKPSFRLTGGELEPMTMETRPSSLRRFVHRQSRLYRLWRKLENSLSRRWAVGYRWRLNRAIFEQIRDDCQRAGVPLLVVYIPVNRRKPVPMFEREFADMGIEYLDLTPLLPADADSLYFPRDHHFNAAGHRFAAQAIRQRLAARGLLQ